MHKKSQTLKTKHIPQEYSIFLLKYQTENPKIRVLKENKKTLNPKFDGTYEIVIGMQKQNGGYFVESTPPRASWYLGKEYFDKLFERIHSPEDFRMVSKRLIDYLVNANYKSFSKKVDGLLKRL